MITPDTTFNQGRKFSGLAIKDVPTSYLIESYFQNNLYGELKSYIKNKFNLK